MMLYNRNESPGPDWVYRRGDVYWVNLDPFFGSEQGGHDQESDHALPHRTYAGRQRPSQRYREPYREASCRVKALGLFD